MTIFSGMNSAVLTTFGQRISILKDGGGEVVLRAIFDHDYVETAHITGNVPVLHCATDDVQSVAVGDTYVANGTAYIVRVMEPDSEGFTKLISERAP